jgi:hypothetical protein
MSLSLSEVRSRPSTLAAAVTGARGYVSTVAEDDSRRAHIPAVRRAIRSSIRALSLPLLRKPLFPRAHSCGPVRVRNVRRYGDLTTTPFFFATGRAAHRRGAQSPHTKCGKNPRRE